MQHNISYLYTSWKPTIQLGGRFFSSILTIPMKLIRLIKMWLSGIYSKVKRSKYLHDTFPLWNGPKQGDTFIAIDF